MRIKKAGKSNCLPAGYLSNEAEGARTLSACGGPQLPKASHMAQPSHRERTSDRQTDSHAITSVFTAG